MMFRGMLRHRNGCTSTPEKDKGSGSFIKSFLKGQLNKQHPDIICGKTCYDLPIKEINKLSSRVVAACTGPSGGLTKVAVQQKQQAFDLPDDADVDYIDDEVDAQINEVLPSKTQISSTTCPANDQINNNRIPNWERSTDFAFGIATTLYEHHPQTSEIAGEPIADAFGLCVRENSAILALADGVNWGVKAKIAARCAIHGSIDYLNKVIYGGGSRIETTMDIFVALLRSFSAAHSLILEENGSLTTLTVAVVAQLKNSDRFIVCTCNVGDSLAYVYSQVHGVREITQGSHDIYSMRDMRDALGALGPVDGKNPELNNLTVAMTIVDKGDIVFLTSDGVSDNFDPVVGKFAIPKKVDKTKNLIPDIIKESVSNSNKSQRSVHSQQKKVGSSTKRSQSGLRRSNSNPNPQSRSLAHQSVFSDFSLPVVSAEQRHALCLLRMEDLLKNGVNAGDTPSSSAKQLCEVMIEFVSKLTTAKRRILEDPDLYDDNDVNFDEFEQRQRRRKVGNKLAMFPGKLDHASIVACKVGFYGSYEGKTFEEKKNGIVDDKKYNLRLKATLAKIEPQDDCYSVQEESTV
ncbi:PP2C-like domain-containing protein [Leptotrombidium deliense]|uniref:PP2C-like domain-containing protein n=1 Tax=Leptotrombidium deliense TaxID=299467 RepID=A0A443S8C8_9ACAR|nr:PP2C-like domain-containing protein [Leptotrombidium deliense]